MQDETFESIDQVTEQLVKQQELQSKLKQMAKRCTELSQALKKEKDLVKQMVGVSNIFDDKLNQMSQLIIDFLALQNYIMKQVDFIQELNNNLKLVKDNLAQEAKIFIETGIQIKQNMLFIHSNFNKHIQENDQVVKVNYKEIITSKNNEIASLKIALESITQSKKEEKKMFEQILKRLTSVQTNTRISFEKTQKEENQKVYQLQKKCYEQKKQIQHLIDELNSFKAIESSRKPIKPKFEMTQVQNNKLSNLKTHEPPCLNWLLSEKYPNKKTSLVQQGQNKALINQMEKLFTFTLQRMTNVISKSSNELLSQLTERDSMQKMQSHISEGKMSLEQIKKKMDTINSSSKKAVESLINDVKSSIQQLLSEQQPIGIRS